MAEEPDIIYSNTPKLLNLSFGKNIFSFYDQNTTGTKCAIEVYDRTLTTKYGTFEAYPNVAGYYHFDLQNLLKNYTTPNYSPFDDVLVTSDNETFEFKVVYGWVGPSGFVNQGTYPSVSEYTNCLVIGGRKRYDELDWLDEEKYVAKVFSAAGCNQPERLNEALTDWNEATPTTKLKGTIPDYLIDNKVYEINKRYNDEYQLYFYSKYEENVSDPPTPSGRFIRAFRLTFYDKDDNLITNKYITNTTTNGGGPGVSPGAAYTMRYPYNVIGLNMGPSYHPDEYDDNIGYVYVSCYTHYGTNAACPKTSTYLSEYATSWVYRINFIEDECNDYPPVQVSWLNKFGFRDYFYFSKRIDDSVNIKRNTYEQVEGTWGSSTFEVNSYDRGEKVFSQDLTIEKSINTKYLTDYEARVLKNLYLSPDVRVRYDGETEWIPIVITNNRWTERTFRKDKFFQYTLNYKEAHKINSQRG